MANSFSIAALYEQAFGSSRGIAYNQDRFYNTDTINQEGLPSFDKGDDDDSLEFVQMRYTLKDSTPQGVALFMPTSIGGLNLPNEPSLSFNVSKRLIETPLVGSRRNGSVIEQIAVENWQITIRGIAINYKSKRVYPEDAVKALKDLFYKNQSLKIECALTKLLGIDRIVLKDLSFPEMIGVQHAQAYEFKAISDEDFDLEID
jgi:hypothetical protein